MPLRWQGDPMRIRQVLTILISNAVKFTEQGEVYVKFIQSIESDSPAKLQFAVHDTGIGISEETRSRLFMPFIQAESSTSRRFGGSGLGLSISKKLVELMGGSIGVNSLLDKGSCFWFTLPIKQSIAEADNTFISPYYDFSGKRSLIVDDNATNRSILNNYLNNWGLTVSETDNGGSALIKLQSSILQGIRYDLILVDMQMSGMEGITFAKCLSKIPTLASLPIILLSHDYFEPSDYQDTGITHCLLKPVRHMQLYNAVVNVLTDVFNTPTVHSPETKQLNYQLKKVLVVEDNKINQKVIVSKLGKFNIVPDVEENGLLALDKLAHCSYDLVFMDCHMPIMDGYTATRELRFLEAQQNLPYQTVIALTANALEGERQKCLTAGMDDYITKPIDSKQLMEILMKYLGDCTLIINQTNH